MVVPGIVRSSWSRATLARYQLSHVSRTREGFDCTRSSSQTLIRNLYDNGRELECIWARFSRNSLASVTERGFATTNPCFTKSKNRGKDKKRPAKIHVNLNELSEIIKVENLIAQMESAIDELKYNYSKNLTIRSSVGSIEQIPIVWEGKEYELQELSQIARKPKTMVINVSAFPQLIPSILQAIAGSGMNLNPQQDGTTLFIPIPKVTKEHRESLAKSAKVLFIGCRDDIKDIHLRSVKSLKNKTGISADVIHNRQSQLQALADGFVDEAEAIFKMKQRELLGDSE